MIVGDEVSVLSTVDELVSEMIPDLASSIRRISLMLLLLQSSVSQQANEQLLSKSNQNFQKRQNLDGTRCSLSKSSLGYGLRSIVFC